MPRLTVSSPLALTCCSLYSVAVSAEITPMELPNQVVTASGFSQQLKDAPASITVITREQLANKSFRDVTDALRSVPGVLVTGGGSSSDISIRGMSSQYTLILVDGKRQDSRATRPNGDNSGIEQGWLPPLAAIERIEVVRGPMSSLYGSDAMGGVINVITRKVSQQWYGNVRSEATLQERADSGNANNTDIFASGPLIDGLLGLQLSGQRNRRDEDGFVKGFKEQSTDSATAKLALTPDTANTFMLEGGHSLQQRDSHRGRSGTKDDHNNYARTHVALSHSGRWDVLHSDSYVQFDRSTNPGREMDLRTTLLNSQMSYFGDRHITTVGGQYLYEDLTDMGNQLESGAGLSTLTRWSWALFAEDEWRFTEAFAVTAGLRLDQDQNYGGHWSPRLYGVYHLDSQWTVKGGVSTGYRSPDIRAAVDNWGQITGGGGDPAIIVGNSGLKPETTVSQELGLIWDGQQGVSAGLTLFRTDFKDRISSVRRCVDSTGNASGECMIGSTAYKFISDRINIDQAQLQGIEATLDWQLSERLSLASNYTFTGSEQQTGAFKGKPLEDTPRHMFNSTLDWRTTDRLATWTRLNYRSSSEEYLRNGKANYTPAYSFVDLGGTYKVTPDLKLLAGVYNVFDKRIDFDRYHRVLDGRRYSMGVDWAI